jgi:hypothetical protein
MAPQAGFLYCQRFTGGRDGRSAMTGTSLPREPGQDRLPVSIWPGIASHPCAGPAAGCRPPRPGGCPVPAISAILTAFAAPGDLVITDPALCGALTPAPAGSSLPGPDAPQPGAVLAVGAAARGAGWYAACRRALRPGGVLAVLTRTPEPDRSPGLSGAIARARSAGLLYSQHIILIHAAISSSQLVPFTPPGHDPAAAGGAACARIHTDLLIFTVPLEAPDDL